MDILIAPPEGTRLRLRSQRPDQTWQPITSRHFMTSLILHRNGTRLGASTGSSLVFITSFLWQKVPRSLEGKFFRFANGSRLSQIVVHEQAAINHIGD